MKKKKKNIFVLSVPSHIEASSNLIPRLIYLVSWREKTINHPLGDDGRVTSFSATWNWCIRAFIATCWVLIRRKSHSFVVWTTSGALVPEYMSPNNTVCESILVIWPSDCVYTRVTRATCSSRQEWYCAQDDRTSHALLAQLSLWTNYLLSQIFFSVSRPFFMFFSPSLFLLE